eukprot:Clim_evm63s156 gene=Clim_evmTU63s156
MANTDQQDSETRIEVFRRVHPRRFVQRFIDSNKRTDGRSFLEYRHIVIEVNGLGGSAEASALVRLGSTLVVCGVTCQIAEFPGADEGNLPEPESVVINLEYTPLCRPDIAPGIPPDDAQSLSRLLQESYCNPDTLDYSKLVLEDCGAQWIISVDLMVLNDAGNVCDAAFLAASAALLNLALPSVDIVDGVFQRTGTATSASNLLKRCPLAVTFRIWDDHTVLFDPTYEEEDAAGGHHTYVLDDNNETIAFEQISMASQVGREDLRRTVANLRIELRKRVADAKQPET